MLSDFDKAAARVVGLKIEIARLEDNLRDAEGDLLAYVPDKDEGEVRATGDLYKATVRFGVNRTLDPVALEQVRDRIPEAMFAQAIEYAPKLRIAGMRYLQSNEPETYAVLAEAITAKPAKPYVRVETVTQEQRRVA